MQVKRIFKIIKYISASCILFVLSSVLGQKNSADYSPINIAHADLPTDGGGGGDSCASGGGTGGGGASGTDGVGTGSSGTGGPGDGSSDA